MSPTWEGIAIDVLEETGCDRPPVSALELATAFSLTAVDRLDVLR